jgi:hypothetical protein
MNANEAGRDPQDSAPLEHLLTVLQEDIRHVHVRITAAIGIAAVFATQIPLRELRAQPWWGEWLTVLGLALLALAAASYFQYTQQLNKLRLKIVAENLQTGGGDSAASWRDYVTPKRRYDYSPGRDVWWFRIGQFLLFAGSVCMAIVLGWLILYG